MATEPALTFERFYREGHAPLVRSVAVLSGSMSLAEDIASEAFVRALERWDRVCDMASPHGWLYRVAVNDLRRRQRRAGWTRRNAYRLVTPDEALAERDLDLWHAVTGLPPRMRTAIVLRYVGGLSETEVAVAMDAAAGTASATLSAARRRLADQLERSIASPTNTCIMPERSPR